MAHVFEKKKYVFQYVKFHYTEKKLNAKALNKLKQFKIIKSLLN